MIFRKYCKFCVLYSFVIILWLSSCTNKKGYIIHGEFPAYPGASVSLMHETMAGWEVVSEVRLNNEGAFMFKGELDFPEFVYITVDKNREFVRFFLENERIRVRAKDSLLRNPEISGSELQRKFEEFDRLSKTEFTDTLFSLYKSWQIASNKGDTLTASRLDSVRAVFYKRKLHYHKAFIKENSDNVLGAFILNLVYSDFETDTLIMLSDQLDPRMDSSLYVQQVRQKIHAIRATKPGQPFLDFALSDSAGTKHQLSTLTCNDKVLVLDFWASWSGKCLLETDKKIELYNRYFDKGVDFVSISLDVNRLKWLKSIDDQKLPWLQLNDGMGPRGDVAKEYLITGLPVKFILDQEGHILNKIRTVEELEKELKSIYD